MPIFRAFVCLCCFLLPWQWTIFLNIFFTNCTFIMLPSFTFSLTLIAVAAKDLSSLLGEATSSLYAMEDRHIGNQAREVQWWTEQRVEPSEERDFWSGLFAYWRALLWCPAWEQMRSREETRWNCSCLSPNSSRLFSFFQASSSAVKQ